MSHDDIYNNAVTSIRIGIEDFENGDERILSAVRNYYSGILLLAKSVLVQKGNVDDPYLVLAKNFIPRTNPDGKIEYIAEGKSTIDFLDIQKRFKSFSIDISRFEKDLEKLQNIRNSIEHFHAKETELTIQETIASTFNFMVFLFEVLEKVPSEELDESWSVILEEKNTYANLLAECKETFKSINFKGNFLKYCDFHCPECNSELIKNTNNNNEPKSIKALCLACGVTSDYEEIIKKALEENVNIQNASASYNGNEDIIIDCLGCAELSYEVEILECLQYGHTYDECSTCSTALTSASVSVNNDTMCYDCDNRYYKIMRE